MFLRKNTKLKWLSIVSMPTYLWVCTGKRKLDFIYSIVCLLEEVLLGFVGPKSIFKGVLPLLLALVFLKHIETGCSMMVIQRVLKMRD